LANILGFLVMVAFVALGITLIAHPQYYQTFLNWVTPPTPPPAPQTNVSADYTQICDDNYEKCRTKLKNEYNLDVVLIEKSHTLEGTDYLVHVDYPFPQTLKVSCVQGQLNTPKDFHCE